MNCVLFLITNSKPAKPVTTFFMLTIMALYSNKGLGAAAVKPPPILFELELTFLELPRVQQQQALVRNEKSLMDPLLESKSTTIAARKTQATATRLDDGTEEIFLLPNMTLQFGDNFKSATVAARYQDCEAKAKTALNDLTQLFRIKIQGFREEQVFIPSNQLVRSFLNQIMMKKASARVSTVMGSWKAGQIPEPKEGAKNTADWEKRFQRLDEIASQRVIRQSFAINFATMMVSCELIPRDSN